MRAHAHYYTYARLPDEVRTSIFSNSVHSTVLTDARIPELYEALQQRVSSNPHFRVKMFLQTRSTHAQDLLLRAYVALLCEHLPNDWGWIIDQRYMSARKTQNTLARRLGVKPPNILAKEQSAFRHLESLLRYCWD